MVKGFPCDMEMFTRRERTVCASDGLPEEMFRERPWWVQVDVSGVAMCT